MLSAPPPSLNLRKSLDPLAKSPLTGVKKECFNLPAEWPPYSLSLLNDSNRGGGIAPPSRLLARGWRDLCVRFKLGGGAEGIEIANFATFWG